MKPLRTAYLAFSACLLCLPAAVTQAATLRCDSGIISEGDGVFAVLKKCGDPARRDVIAPIVGANGRTPDKAVPVENWVYGPRNGVYRHLRFIDGKLVTISTKPL